MMNLKLQPKQELKEIQTEGLFQLISKGRQVSKHMFSKTVNFKRFLNKSLFYIILFYFILFFYFLWQQNLVKMEDKAKCILGSEFLLTLISYVMSCSLSTLNYYLSVQNEMQTEEGITQII